MDNKSVSIDISLGVYIYYIRLAIMETDSACSVMLFPLLPCHFFLLLADVSWTLLT